MSKTAAPVYIVNLETRESIKLHFIPKEIEWEAKSNVATIASIARNNPFYHFTGGEDIINLELDWHAYDVERTSAIDAAIKLKSWTRNDGYRRGLPRLKLIFGKLFENHVFIATGAPYIMSMFQMPKGMMPAQVTQKLTLKKVTLSNDTRKTIINSR